jgi:hypothetical protein
VAISWCWFRSCFVFGFGLHFFSFVQILILADIYDTINHYLKGIALIDTKGKNVDTAKLFLRTARKAKTLRAFSAGHLLLKTAVRFPFRLGFVLLLLFLPF